MILNNKKHDLTYSINMCLSKSKYENIVKMKMNINLYIQFPYKKSVKVV